MKATIISSLMTAVSTITATEVGNSVIMWVALGINVLTLVSNACLDIYRKWRDRDADKKEGAKKVETDIKKDESNDTDI